MPIVTGERRKVKRKQAEGKRTCRKKANAVRLCADDLMSRERLVAAKTEAKTALVAKGRSLLGSGKLKEMKADNRTLCKAKLPPVTKA